MGEGMRTKSGARLDFSQIDSTKLAVPTEAAYEGFGPGVITGVTGLTALVVAGPSGELPPVALSAAPLGGPLTLDGLSSLTLTGTPVYSWSIGDAIAVSGTNPANGAGPISAAGFTIGSAGTLSPTLSAGPDVLLGALGGDPANVADGLTTVLTIPLAVTVTYRGASGVLPVRSATFATSVTYAFTGAA
jgi:hypothetical protein